ncbi:MAG: TolC family protein [Bacteroidales bacterium]|nr:TolC family protein [Bacteroidales bacterium]
MMKKYITVLVFGFVVSITCSAQVSDTLKLTPKQVEDLFIKQNLELLAERLSIDIADAAIAQARLWENPELTIGDVNFWASEERRDGEDIPPLFGNFGRNTQFTVELSQMIQMGGKRRKLIRLEQTSKDIAIAEFEDVLRNLKLELQTSVNELIYVQAFMNVLNRELELLTQVVESHRRQAAQGNIARTELLRFESALQEVESEIYENFMELNALQTTLKVLLNIPPTYHLTVISENPSVKNPTAISIMNLSELALSNRPDLKVFNLQTQFHERELSYEKAHRVPDLTVSANYDRYGGIWGNYFGVGVSMPLPVFDRNQGNIRTAKISIDQTKYMSQQQQNIVRHEVTEAYNNFLMAHRLYERINNRENLSSELDVMLDVYLKNLMLRNIGILEFLDFLETYKTNKEVTLSARKNLNTAFQTLQYAVGTEF